MELVRQKNPDAFEALYDRHGGPAYSLAHRITGEPQAAEDVTQEAFLSIWRTSSSYEPSRGSFRSWMLGIIRNRSVDVLRRSSSRAPKLNLDDDALMDAQPAAERTDGEAIRRERAREVRGALHSLPPDQSQVIGLAYFGGFSHSEIADLLEMPLGTVKGRMRLGLEKVRARMEGVLS
jgi:RNA polymerase sigma-70 factor (ECF subfamily)